MLNDHILSEDAVKKMNLDKSSIDKNATPVKVYKDYNDYFSDKILGKHDKWFKRIYNTFDYIISMFRFWKNDVKWYFSNLKRFQSVIKTWRPYDYHYQTELFTFGLGQLADTLEKYGNEVNDIRKKRIAAIRELINEINRDYEDDVKSTYSKINEIRKKKTTITEYSDGSIRVEYDNDEDTEKLFNQEYKKYYKALSKERKAHFNKIYNLLIGQDLNKLSEDAKVKFEELSKTDNSVTYEDVYKDLFDGSGIEGWWD